MSLGARALEPEMSAAALLFRKRNTRVKHVVQKECSEGASGDGM